MHSWQQKFALQDSHLKLLSQYSIRLKAKDTAEPTIAEYTASTVTALNETVLEFSDSFQYGRLWEGLLLGMNCGGIPLSERFDLSLMNHCCMYYT